ncbi:hypothetical protein [Niabella hirudinis]|uniref:hypothetical protein n=1 Tax=Niabella hirudinis TaxID=1285929 RepID=UPI003EC12167
MQYFSNNRSTEFQELYPFFRLSCKRMLVALFIMVSLAAGTLLCYLDHINNNEADQEKGYSRKPVIDKNEKGYHYISVNTIKYFK